MKILSWLFDPRPLMFGYAVSRAHKFMMWCLLAAFIAVYGYGVVLFSSSLSAMFAFSWVLAVVGCILVYAILPLVALMAAYAAWDA